MLNKSLLFGLTKYRNETTFLSHLTWQRILVPIFSVLVYWIYDPLYVSSLLQTDCVNSAFGFLILAFL